MDNAPGGPFAIFDNHADGWRAGVTCLLAYQDLHGLDTIDGIVHRWAPSSDHNDEDQYATLVSELAGLPRTAKLNLHDGATMLKLVKAMSVEEGGHLPWPQSEVLAGIRLAGLSI